MQDTKKTSWIFIFFVIVILYSTGAGIVESLVNYPLWHIIGQSDVWIPYHRALGPKIILALAVPALLLSLIFNIWLFFKRPVSLPKWTIWTCLVLLLIAVISSATIQIPIQAKLDQGYSKELVDELIVTSFWLRDLMGIIRVGIVGYMLYRVIERR
jgi:nitric oxide reductase large subunit